MQDELRARFRTRFIDTARGRVKKSVGLLSSADGAKTLMTELHSLAGEAALLGLKDISGAARKGELAAREWLEGNVAAKLRCVRLVRQVSRHVEAFAAEPPEPIPGDEPSASDNSRRVLVIDDSALAGEHIADSLEDSGLETKLATDPATAIAVVKEFEPRMVISDVNMPGVDLADLTRQLRSAARTPMQVVLLSGMNDSELAERAAEVGADGYISKQHGAEFVIEHVSKLLKGAKR